MDLDAAVAALAPRLAGQRDRPHGMSEHGRGRGPGRAHSSGGALETTRSPRIAGGLRIRNRPAARWPGSAASRVDAAARLRAGGPGRRLRDSRYTQPTELQTVMATMERSPSADCEVLFRVRAAGELSFYEIAICDALVRRRRQDAPASCSVEADRAAEGVARCAGRIRLSEGEWRLNLVSSAGRRIGRARDCGRTPPTSAAPATSCPSDWSVHARALAVAHRVFVARHRALASAAGDLGSRLDRRPPPATMGGGG